jgi:hypothetical protein
MMATTTAKERTITKSLRTTAKQAITETYHRELALIADHMARQIIKERPQIRELMGQLIEEELRASLKQLGITERRAP